MTRLQQQQRRLYGMGKTMRTMTGLSRAAGGSSPQRTAWIAVIAVTAMSSGGVAAPATSKQKTPIFVVEAHTGERPREIAPLVETLDDELEKRGFAARATTILQIAAGLPRPGVLDKGVTMAQIALDVDNGYDLFTKGTMESYHKAIVILLRAVDAIRRNPALIVLNTSNIDVIERAYITLALCQAYLGDADWTSTMMREIRMFPTRPFPRADYGPDDEKLYKKVYKQAQTMGRGRLSIAAENSQAVVFVDGQIRGVDKVVLANLIPGTYHVFIQVPGSPGRQYEVEVTANDDSFLNVEPEIDSSFWATDSWIGFQFASNQARGQEAKFAGQIATKWSGRDLIGVVGTRRRAGRLVLTGSIYTTDGTMLRGMALDIQTATPTSLRQLARLMAEGGVPSDGITLIEGGVLAAETRDDTTHGPWWRRSSPYLMGGAALVLASTALYVGTPADDYTKPTYSDYRSPAVLTFMGGSVVLGSGVYLWLRDERSATVLAAATIAGGVAATLSGVMLYATDEDLHTQGWQRPTYRDSAGAGVVWGTAGLAATSIGLFLLWRDRRSPIVPAATVGDHHGLVSVSGTF